jgi:hypothetical protein
MAAWLAAAQAEGVLANMDGAEMIGSLAQGIVAKRTGALAGSIEASPDGDDALVGPTGSARSKNGPYGRFHELGGVHDAHNPSGYMWWPTGVWTFHAAHQVKGPHPYLKPAVDLAEGTGELGRVYYDAWLKAQQSAA